MAASEAERAFLMKASLAFYSFGVTLALISALFGEPRMLVGGFVFVAGGMFAAWAGGWSRIPSR